MGAGFNGITASKALAGARASIQAGGRLRSAGRHDETAFSRKSFTPGLASPRAYAGGEPCRARHYSGRAARDLRQARSGGRHGLRYLFGRILRASVPRRLFGTGEGRRNGRGRSVRLRRAGRRRRRRRTRLTGIPKSVAAALAVCTRFGRTGFALSFWRFPDKPDAGRSREAALAAQARARSTIRRTSPRAGSGCSAARRTPACRARRSPRWRASTG